MKIFWIIIAIVLAVGGWYFLKNRTDLFTSTTNPMNPKVSIFTSKGTIELELFADKAPKTVQNFITLADKNFFDDTLFHRVIDGFMIQGGDPNTRSGDPSTWGTGGPGYTIDDEFSNGLSNTPGYVAMAHSSFPHSAGSQFFINVADNSSFLDGKYTVFGKVIKGMDVAIAISKVPRDANDRPLDPVRIDSVVVSK